MRDIASRFGVARCAAALAVLTTLTAAVTASTAAAATVLPPTIATQYTPNQIAITQTSGITYTITDPNASGSLYQIGFNDTLPSTSAVDDPAAVTNSGCGSAVAITASPGAPTISAAAIQIKAGTPCTISVAITGNTVGTASDAFSDVLYTSSSATYAIPGAVPAANETPASLQVLGAPTVAAKTPKAKAVYTYGEVVKASYSCAAAAGDDPTQLTCTAFDDLGNTINSGQKLNTTVPGKHQLDIEAISGLTSATTDLAINYTVLPDSVFTLSGLKTAKHGTVTFTLALPGAGKVALLETAGKTTFSTKTVSVGGKKKLKVTLKPTKKGSALLKNGTVKLKLSVAFTPKGGVKRTLTKSGIKLK